MRSLWSLQTSDRSQWDIVVRNLKKTINCGLFYVEPFPFWNFRAPDCEDCPLCAAPSFCQMPGTLPLLLDSVVGGGTPGGMSSGGSYGSLFPVKDLVLPKTNVNEVADNSKYLLISLTNDGMSKNCHFLFTKH
ncbi:hypothetical protein TNCV_2968321 [Trichonephila clavipes]|nr:hypothetical protein TNCV_2968321 [Trichonephila clavipes]